MPRLIDANEAQRYFEESTKACIPPENEYEAGQADAYTATADYISDCKTVDAEPVITADEMFRELGYKKMGTTTYPSYGNESKNVKITIITAGKMAVIKTDMLMNIKSMNAGEILACAQLIKEMEAE